MIERAYFDGPYGQVHVHRDGSGAPLILLHQSPLDGTSFKAAFPHLLAAGFCPVAIDTPGYGASSAPPGPISIEEFADAILAVIKQLTPNPVKIVGHHTGASLAISIAARYPDVVKQLVLHGVALLTPEEKDFYAAQTVPPIQPKLDGSHLLALWEQRRATTSHWADAELMHEHVVTMLRSGNAWQYGFEAVFNHDLSSDLGEIRCPTLIMAEESDGLFEASRRAVAQRPDFSFARLPEAKRDIITDCPEVWTKFVTDFLGDGKLSDGDGDGKCPTR